MAGWTIKRRKVRGKPGKNWWIEARIDGRRHRETTGESSRAKAEAWARERYRELVEESEGRSVVHRGEGVVELIAQYSIYQEGRGTNAKHRAEVEASLVRMVAELGAVRLDDITAEGVRQALDSMTTMPGKGHKSHQPRPLSPQRKNGYRQALNQFFRWLVREQRARVNPIDAIPAYRVIPGEARPERRALSAGELGRLIEAAPPHRALVYRVASCTGLRRKELGALAWSRIDLAGGVAMLDGRRNKSRRLDSVPLGPATVAALAEHKRDPWACYWTERDGAQVWPQGLAKKTIARRINQGLALPPPPRMATLRADLERAGIDDGDGWIVDLHSLRVTFGTNLARAGVDRRDTQRLMRHTDPKLTERVYVRLQLADYRGGVDALERYLDASTGADTHLDTQDERAG